jgi:hypothetical protein
MVNEQDRVPHRAPKLWNRGRGGTGRHPGFRSRCSKELEGSSPSARILPGVENPLRPYAAVQRSRNRVDAGLSKERTPKGGLEMYIGGGVLTLILVILLLVWLF